MEIVNQNKGKSDTLPLAPSNLEGERLPQQMKVDSNVDYSNNSQNNSVVTNSPSKLEGVRGRVLDLPSKLEGARGSVLSRTKNTPDMKKYRRELRNNSTPAEKALWKLIKGKQIDGLRFRRQFSIGNYILDFFCPSLDLAIELDGEYHNDDDTFEKDQTRVKELLDKYHIQTLRFENKIVFQQPETIINSIVVFRNSKLGMASSESSSLSDTLPHAPSNLEGERLPHHMEVDSNGDHNNESQNNPVVTNSPSKLEGVRGSVSDLPSKLEGVRGRVSVFPSKLEGAGESVSPPKAIIFDFGGVVVTLDHPQAVEKFRQLGLVDAEKKLNPYTQGGIFGQLELGLLTAGEFVEELSKLCHRTLTYNDCLDAWLGYRKELPQRNLDALVRLRKEGYRLILLSNTNPFMMHWASSPDFDGQGHPVEAYFDAVCLSYKFGVMKPDEKFFRRVLEEQNLQPEETLFIDDGPRNVAAASQLGIQTFCPENGTDWTQPLFQLLSRHT